MTATGAAPDIETIAKTAHATYLRGQLAAGKDHGASSALIAWEELSEEYREASRAQARDILAKLALIGARVEALAPACQQQDFLFTDVELALLARCEHDRWMAHKVSRGWSLGPRDDALKTHPCLVPYDELPEVEQRKDEDVVLEIPNLLRVAGYRIVRGSEGHRR